MEPGTQIEPLPASIWKKPFDKSELAALRRSSFATAQQGLPEIGATTDPKLRVFLSTSTALIILNRLLLEFRALVLAMSRLTSVGRPTRIQSASKSTSKLSINDDTSVSGSTPTNDSAAKTVSTAEMTNKGRIIEGSKMKVVNTFCGHLCAIGMHCA